MRGSETTTQCAPGIMLGHYHILEKIGAGGMGQVFRAHDEHLDCDVALKVLPPDELADDAARKRFRKEALALSRLNHPNIAVVHDFDTQDGTDFLVEELIVGLSLSEMLVCGPLAEREIVRLGSQLAEGLAAAHQQGVIHRDLKPANLRVTSDGRLKILDFGLAHIAPPPNATELTASETETGSIAGTLPYMAPEQLLGAKVDARSDIWAAGCVLYEMATGRRPFSSSGAPLIDAILHQLPTTPLKLNPQLSAGMESVILKCLEKDPALRYQSAGEISVDLRRLMSPPALQPPAAPLSRARRHTVRVGLGVLVLAFVAAAGFWLPRRHTKITRSEKTTTSIAVLPFVDMSPQKDQEYFSDGLAEELLNSLTKIPDLRVTARTSSFQFKGKNEDLRVIGQKLNVDTVLEGSVRKQGNRIRITAQLIKVSDGFHLWSETYDREVSDIFSVQENIARSVAGSLRLALLGNTVISATRGGNAEAYDAYLQGRYFYERSGKENLEKAVTHYEQAIKLDPGYAPAWAGLSRARGEQALAYGSLPLQEGIRKARQAAERALALDANLPEAHAAMGVIQTSYDWDWAGADASFQRALALDPGNATVAPDAAWLAVALGRFDQALALGRQALEVDPLNANLHGILGMHTYYAGRPEQAIAVLKKALELNPETPAAHWSLGVVYLALARPADALSEMQREREQPMQRLQGLALVYYALGRKKESDAALAELIAKYRDISAFQIAEAYAFRGETDHAFEWLERAYAQRDGGLTLMKGDPLLKSIKHDPRYATFLVKMRLPLDSGTAPSS